MDSAPAKVVFFLILITALAMFQAWQAAAAVQMTQDQIGTSLVGLVGDLGDAEGIEAGLTVATLDARCGEGKWSVWYELGTSGDVVPGSIVVACE